MIYKWVCLGLLSMLHTYPANAALQDELSDQRVAEPSLNEESLTLGPGIEAYSNYDPLTLAFAPTPPKPSISEKHQVNDDQLVRIRVYVMWGQSHMVGTRVSDFAAAGFSPPYWADIVPGSPYPVISNAYIFDKFKRGRKGRHSYKYYEDYDMTGRDLSAPPGAFCSLPFQCSDRPVEGYSLQPLTAGFGPQTVASVANFGLSCQELDFYPWEPCTQQFVHNPAIGPEMAFADEMRKRTGDIIVIAKFAIPGTNVTKRDLPEDPTPQPSWHPSATSAGAYGQPYLNTLLDYYVDQTIRQARFMALNENYALSIGGVISWIGSNDVKESSFPTNEHYNPQWAAWHQAAHEDAIAAVRARIVQTTSITNPLDVPHLVMLTPSLDMTSFNQPAATVQTLINNQNTVRMGQMNIPTPTNGVSVKDPDTAFTIPPGMIHSDAIGYSRAGALMADWAEVTPPVDIP